MTPTEDAGRPGQQEQMTGATSEARTDTHTTVKRSVEGASTSARGESTGAQDLFTGTALRLGLEGLWRLNRPRITPPPRGLLIDHLVILRDTITREMPCRFCGERHQPDETPGWLL